MFPLLAASHAISEVAKGGKGKGKDKGKGLAKAKAKGKAKSVKPPTTTKEQGMGAKGQAILGCTRKVWTSRVHHSKYRTALQWGLPPEASKAEARNASVEAGLAWAAARE
eukprot:2893442-Alexandrium_andersonii.AAC.1